MEAGARADTLDGKLRTPLILAALNGETHACCALLAHGADLLVVDGKLGRMPIMFGIMGGNLSTVEALADAHEYGAKRQDGLRAPIQAFQPSTLGADGSVDVSVGDGLEARAVAPSAPAAWMVAVDRRGQTCADIARDADMDEVSALLDRTKRQADERAQVAATAAAEAAVKAEAARVEKAERAAAEKAARAQRQEEADRAKAKVAAERAARAEAKAAAVAISVSETPAPAATSAMLMPEALPQTDPRQNQLVDSDLTRSEAPTPERRSWRRSSAIVRAAARARTGLSLRTSVFGRATADATRQALKKEYGLRAAFAVFDKDGSGSLSAEELKAVLTRPGGGAALSDEEVRAIIDEFDANGDGELQ